jgi:hypothetical protein
MVAGRAFTSADALDGLLSVIDRTFVKRFLGEGNPLAVACALDDPRVRRRAGAG